MPKNSVFRKIFNRLEQMQEVRVCFQLGAEKIKAEVGYKERLLFALTASRDYTNSFFIMRSCLHSSNEIVGKSGNISLVYNIFPYNSWTFPNSNALFSPSKTTKKLFWYLTLAEPKQKRRPHLAWLFLDKSLQLILRYL